MKCSHLTNSRLVIWGMENDSRNKKRLKIFTGKRGGRRLTVVNRDRDRKKVSGQAPHEGCSRGGLVPTMRALARLLRVSF